MNTTRHHRDDHHHSLGSWLNDHSMQSIPYPQTRPPHMTRQSTPASLLLGPAPHFHFSFMSTTMRTWFLSYLPGKAQAGHEFWTRKTSAGSRASPSANVLQRLKPRPGWQGCAICNH
jgi:hypothetical protein